MGASIEERVPAMGSTAHLLLVGAPSDLMPHLLWRLKQLEACWSRFVPDSEVNTINRRAGELVFVSEDTFELVEKAGFARQATNGRFDPLMLDPLRAAGYDRSFSDIANDAGAPVECWEPSASNIALDRAGRAVQIPAGYGLDPGGIGKGLAADLLAAEAIAGGAKGALVSIGGDLRVVGSAPDGPTWGIQLAEPTAGIRLDEVLALGEGAVATSTTRKRTWGPGKHHLLDATTGRPLDEKADGSNIVLVTAVAGEAWWADVAAKVHFDPAAPPLEHVAGLRLTAAGERLTFGDFERYFAPEEVAA
jgi:thiamine biosynthesis lipoprotein